MNSNKLSLSPFETKALGYAIVIALIGGAFFLKPYFGLIIVAIILTFLFFPVYDWLFKRSQKAGRAAMQTLVVSFLAIIIPVSLIIFFSVQQIDSLIQNTDFTALTDSITQLLEKGNELLAKWNIQIDAEQVTATIQEGIQAFGQSIVSGIPGLFSGFLAFITSSIIFIYVFLSLLKFNDKIVDLVNTLNPLGKDVSSLYMSKMSSMTKATVRGQFIIAFCQGLESALVLSLAGMSDLFFFFLVFLTALSVIPMGAGIVTIPIGVLQMLSGNIWGGALIIANHLIIVTNIDNVLRPKLVPKDARLDPALMILAVFSGVAYFGFLGIVLGPVIMIVVKTTIDIYLEVYRNIHMERHENETKKRKNLFRRVGKKAKDILPGI